MTRGLQFTLFDRNFYSFGVGIDRLGQNSTSQGGPRPSRGADAMTWAGRGSVRLQAKSGRGCDGVGRERKREDVGRAGCRECEASCRVGYCGVGTYLRLQLTPVQVVNNYSKLMISHGFAREIKLKRSLVLEFDTFNLLYRIVNNPIYTRAKTTVSTFIVNKMLRWLAA